MSPWFPFDLTHEPGELRLGLFTHHEREERGGVNPQVDALWNIFDVLGACIRADAELLSKSGTHHISPDATIHPSCVLDTSAGPILVDAGVRIEPFVYIRGPVAIGRNTLIRAGTRLYGPVVIGPVCKIGGELEDTVVHGFSNKQHDGFLGHSWVGEWCNLGAGTITSDLKNTYGPVSLETPNGRLETGRTFLGSLLGDHTRTAIGTRFMTGTVTGVFTNIACPDFPPRFVPSFTWDVVHGSQYSIDKALEVARTVMSRRQRTLDASMEERLRALAATTDLDP
jgi:UDP-N-acetylglucosamine diphosphorylase/glucosamine-1-phosphate N-acetyltransferase